MFAIILAVRLILTGRMGSRGSAKRNEAQETIVAIAYKFVVVVWHMLTKSTVDWITMVMPTLVFRAVSPPYRRQVRRPIHLDGIIAINAQVNDPRCIRTAACRRAWLRETSAIFLHACAIA